MIRAIYCQQNTVFHFSIWTKDLTDCKKLVSLPVDYWRRATVQKAESFENLVAPPLEHLQVEFTETSKIPARYSNIETSDGQMWRGGIKCTHYGVNTNLNEGA